MSTLKIDSANMNKIYSAKRPGNSIIRECMYRDFSDCYAMKLERNDIIIDDVVNCFFTVSPNILTKLMRLRDFMTKFIGPKSGINLKTKDLLFTPENEKGLFTLYKCNNQEAIIGADQKNLSLRTSLYLKTVGQTTEVIISSVVLMNNDFGRCYMKFISPFHKVVVKCIMKLMYETLMSLPQKKITSAA